MWLDVKNFIGMRFLSCKNIFQNLIKNTIEK